MITDNGSVMYPRQRKPPQLDEADKMKPSDGNPEGPHQKDQIAPLLVLPPTKDDVDVKSYSKTFLAILAILAACLLSALSSSIVKLLPNYHPFSLAIWRFQGILWISLLSLLYTSVFKHQNVFKAVSPRDNLNRLILLVLRGVIGCTGLLLHFSSLRFIPLGDATVITAVAPVFVILGAHLFLHEKCGLVPVLLGVVAMVGVVVIVRPPMLTGEETFGKDTLIGTSMAAGCMMSRSGTTIILRSLREVNHSLVTFVFGSIATVYTLVLIGGFGLSVEIPTNGRDWILGLCLAIFSSVSQTLVTISLQYGAASFIGLCRISEVLFAFLCQFLLLGVIPDFYSGVGAAVVLASIVTITFRKWVDELSEDQKLRQKFAWILK